MVFLSSLAAALCLNPYESIILLCFSSFICFLDLNVVYELKAYGNFALSIFAEFYRIYCLRSGNVLMPEFGSFLQVEGTLVVPVRGRSDSAKVGRLDDRGITESFGDWKVEFAIYLCLS